MGKRALTEQDIAAMAAGAAIGAAALAEAGNGGAAQDEAGNGGAAQTEANPAGAEAGTSADPTAPSEGVVSAEADNSASAVQLLTAQLKDKDESLVTARVEIAQLKAQLDTVQATHSDLVAIALKSVNNMRVAMNSAPLSADSVDAVKVLAEHKAVTEQFVTKFKVGGVAAVSADQSVKNEPVAKDALAQARLAAVPRFARKGA